MIQNQSILEVYSKYMWSILQVYLSIRILYANEQMYT